MGFEGSGDGRPPSSVSVDDQDAGRGLLSHGSKREVNGGHRPMGATLKDDTVHAFDVRVEHVPRGSRYICCCAVGEPCWPSFNAARSNIVHPPSTKAGA
jgi:hypothetical protein